MTEQTDLAALARGLDRADATALREFPMLRAADPIRRQAAVTFGSLWRKLSEHLNALRRLERLGVVERRMSRGETLWRPTKPLGLALRAHLQEQRAEEGFPTQPPSDNPA